MDGRIHCFQFSALANKVALHLPPEHLSTRVRKHFNGHHREPTDVPCMFTLSAVALGLTRFPVPSPVLVFIKPFPFWPIQQIPKWHLTVALMSDLSCIQQIFTECLMCASTWDAAVKNSMVPWTSSQSMRCREAQRRLETGLVSPREGTGELGVDSVCVAVEFDVCFHPESYLKWTSHPKHCTLFFDCSLLPQACWVSR